jgi:hypothetical protein
MVMQMEAANMFSALFQPAAPKQRITTARNMLYSFKSGADAAPFVAICE